MCIDKTGTLTRPGMRLEKIEPVAGWTSADIAEVVGAVAAADPAPNATVQALGAGCSASGAWTVERRVPFSSARKWSGVSFAGKGAWLLGAPAEGRRVIANIERVAGLFVTKTVYAAILAVAVGLAGIPFPFFPAISPSSAPSLSASLGSSSPLPPAPRAHGPGLPGGRWHSRSRPGSRPPRRRSRATRSRGQRPVSAPKPRAPLPRWHCTPSACGSLRSSPAGRHRPKPRWSSRWPPASCRCWRSRSAAASSACSCRPRMSRWRWQTWWSSP